MAKRILIKPLITEKTTKLSEANGTYGFVVGMDANKIEIKNAVEKNYGVTVAGKELRSGSVRAPKDV